jgi:NitT/TauT family transport system permease protein
MLRRLRLFKIEQPSERPFRSSDLVILIGLGVMIYGGVRLAFGAPAVIQGPAISLQPSNLPYYAARSLGRMGAAYLLSLAFSLIYGSAAARNRKAEQFLMPLLDVLQSVPILSFLPVVLLSLSAVLPQRLAVELASIVLIFTSQAWNMTYAWYQSLTTLPKELREASTIFHFNPWLRFKVLELPFAAISLIWNSVMSWAGGWFFLMAAEIFTVGQRDFRLPGLGAYLQEAALQGNFYALGWGIATLVLIVVILDQFLWRPLLAWGDRFKLEMVESQNPATSWFYDLLSNSFLVQRLIQGVVRPVSEGVDGLMTRLFPTWQPYEASETGPAWGYLAAAGVFLSALFYGAYRMSGMLLQLSPAQWGEIGLGLLATLGRVAAALLIALLWTIPLGVKIGTSPRLAATLQPVVQIAASLPATALFPAFLLVFLPLPGGLNLAAVFLMLMGTQWYLLFNVIAGASAIPQDLKYTAAMLQLNGWGLWRTLILPALFPYVITGAITASGGAWNASIVAEHVSFGGQSYYEIGIGALIARATASGDYPLLLAATLSMVTAVVLINRLVWRRLYRLAEERYRLE